MSKVVAINEDIPTAPNDNVDAGSLQATNPNEDEETQIKDTTCQKEKPGNNANFFDQQCSAQVPYKKRTVAIIGVLLALIVIIAIAVSSSRSSSPPPTSLSPASSAGINGSPDNGSPSTNPSLVDNDSISLPEDEGDEGDDDKNVVAGVPAEKDRTGQDNLLKDEDEASGYSEGAEYPAYPSSEGSKATTQPTNSGGEENLVLLDDGQYCTSNDVCVSSLCIRNYCRERLFDDGERCSWPEFCASGSCAYNRENSGGRVRICCPTGGETFSKDDTNMIFCEGVAPAGTQCSDPRICASGMCIMGTCVDALLQDGETCRSDVDCANGKCTSRHSNREYPKVCCPNGESTTINDRGINKEVCLHAPSSTYCGSNPAHDEICQSQKCIDNYCADTGLNDGEKCKQDHHCQSGKCAHGDAKISASNPDYNKICCPGGNYFTDTIRGITYDFCKEAEQGTTCGNSDASYDEMCASGHCVGKTCANLLADMEIGCSKNDDCHSGKCAQNTLGYQVTPGSANSMCCPGGKSMPAMSTWGRPIEICVGVAPVGTQCNDYDVFCQSGVCVDRYCKEGQVQDFLQCESDSDCLNNVCGNSGGGTYYTDVCCPNGDFFTRTFADRRGVIDTHTFCRGMPQGTNCHSYTEDMDYDEMCASGYCIQGACQDKQLDDMETCTQDSNCSSGVCGRSVIGRWCCPKGEFFIVNETPDRSTPTNVRYCKNMPSGTRCYSYDAERPLHDLCASGQCENRECK